MSRHDDRGRDDGYCRCRTRCGTNIPWRLRDHAARGIGFHCWDCFVSYYFDYAREHHG